MYMFEVLKAIVKDRFKKVTPEEIWANYLNEIIKDREDMLNQTREFAKNNSIEDIAKVIKENNPDETEEKLFEYLEAWKRYKEYTEEDWETERKKETNEAIKAMEEFKNTREGEEYIKFEQEHYRYRRLLDERMQEKSAGKGKAR